jgi:hypothetical protein
MHNPSGPATFTPVEPAGQKYYWRKLGNASRPGEEIPVFADCIWDGTGPYHSDTPPPKKGVQVFGASGNLSNFAIPRHPGARPVNMTFSDSSVR